jgi:membrane associated rhomboid family serine protease
MEKAISPKPYKALLPPFLFVSSLWIVHLALFISHTSGVSFGIYPRNAFGISGVISSVFIHDDWNHLFNNSLPLLILGWALFHFYKEVAYPVLAYIWLVSGFWLWLIGRESFHIGASGIVYGLAAFLILSGILRKEIRVAGVSLLVVFLYGSMIWGLFPIDYHISFEAHICGALAGLFMAWFYRRSGIQAPVFKWEDEEDFQEDENAYWKAPLTNPNIPEISPDSAQKKGEPDNPDSPLP